MKFTQNEKNIILQWYEYYAVDSRHYGDGTVTFPNEAIIVNKLKSSEDRDFSGYELDMIRDWMMKSVRRQYGESSMLLGPEQLLFEKLKAK